MMTNTLVIADNSNGNVIVSNCNTYMTFWLFLTYMLSFQRISEV